MGLRWHRGLSATIGVVLAACTLPPPRTMLDESSARATMPPIARLGRWSDGHFVEVTPESLPPSHLRVLVHGWTPGLDRSEAREGLRSWERPSGEGAIEPWIAELAETFTENDPYTVVVAYSWVDGSTTVRAPLAERSALSRTNVHGALLAEALEAALAPDFFDRYGSVHLVGHSYGARVASVAAGELPEAPAQLTVFDAPDTPLTSVTGSATRLAELLSVLPIGWGRAHTFVDSYVSMVGRRYASMDSLSGVVDVVLAPPFGAMAYRPRHVYPMEFYAGSAGSGVGYDWSPLTGHAAPASGCWEQDAGAAIALHHGCNGVP